MPISQYIAGIRQRIGHDLLMLPAVTGVVLDEAGAILLARRRDNGAWSLPSGAIDPGEQPADAVVREVYEETGVIVVADRIAGVALHPATYTNGDQCQYLNVWFRCRAVAGEACVNDEESVAVGWFDRHDLPDLDPWAWLRLETALTDQPAAWFAQPGAAPGALTTTELL